MKLLGSRRHLLLVLPIICAASQQQCFANPGDLITHTTRPTTTVHTTVSTYRVSGWQNELTTITPNLGNYYWEPMTKRMVNTTRTTSRGATAAPPIVTKGPQYVKPNFAPLPTVSHPQPRMAIAQALPTAVSRTSTSLSYSTTPQPVLSYQNNTSLSWSSGKKPQATAAVTMGSRESVYGVLKTPISSMRAKTQSL
jgi:hypothetical protein